MCGGVRWRQVAAPPSEAPPPAGAPLGRLPLLLAGAIALHNAEEIAMLPRFPAALAVPRSAGLPVVVPEIATIQIGLAMATAVSLAILWRVHRRPSPRLLFVTVMIAAMTAANALVPHLLAAGLLGSYVPGLVTALTLTLPVGGLVIGFAGGRRILRGARLVAACILGVVLIPLVLLGFWALGELVRELAG
jgi:hypothetical protein